jgi:Ca2+-binding RTX toxin-like protein
LQDLFGLSDYGNDVIHGSSGIDVIFGGDGNDDIRTGGGVIDIAFGNKHDDTLDGMNTYINLLIGGEGNDTVHGSRMSGATQHITTNLLLGDTFDVGDLGPDVGIEYDGATQVFKLSGGVKGFHSFGKGNDTIYSYRGYNLMFGGEGDDTMYGNGLLNVMFGDALNIGAEIAYELNVKKAWDDIQRGEDIVPAIYNNSKLVPTWPGLVGNGKDTIKAGTTSGGSTDPIINLVMGGSGDDTIEVKASLANVVFGNFGNDTIDASSSRGVTAILGGDGDDTITGSAEYPNLLLGDSLALPAPGGLDLEALKEGILVATTPLGPVGNGEDTIQGGNGFIDVIMGGDGADDIDGKDGTINFILGDGFGMPAGARISLSLLRQTLWDDWDPDRLWQVLQEQFYLQGLGHDKIKGGTAWDIVAGGSGNDAICGGDSWDALYGGDGNDIICGGNDDDRLVGGPGEDCLDGQLGTDSHFGQAGRDGFNFNTADERLENTDYNPEEDDLGCGRMRPLTLNKDAIEEGDTVILSGGFSADCLSNRQVKIDWGDGQEDILSAWALDVPHVYEDDKPAEETDQYVIVVSDNATGELLGTKTLPVANVAPRVGLVPFAPTAYINQDLRVTAPILEPGIRDELELHVKWGDGGSSDYTYAAGTTEFTVTHKYTEARWYSIEFKIKDDDDGESTRVMNVEITEPFFGGGEGEAEGEPALLAEYGLPLLVSSADWSRYSAQADQDFILVADRDVYGPRRDLRFYATSHDELSASNQPDAAPRNELDLVGLDAFEGQFPLVDASKLDSLLSRQISDQQNQTDQLLALLGGEDLDEWQDVWADDLTASLREDLRARLRRGR